MLLGIFTQGSFTTTPGMNLRFDNGERATERFKSGRRFISRSGDTALRNRYVSFPQKLLCLILVDFHLFSFREIETKLDAAAAPWHKKMSRLRANEYKCPRKVRSTVFGTQQWVKENKIDAPAIPFELPGATA
jgi:hypothetical protein